MPKRKKPVTRQLHHFVKRFDNIKSIKDHILSELKDEFPDDATIDVGYYDGRQSSKVWLVSSEDLSYMYKKCKGSEILLWVEYRADEESEDEDQENTCPMRKKQKQTSKRQGVEDEVESTYNQLAKKHGNSVYSGPQLRLWARMIQDGSHDDYDDPPRVPQITGVVPKQVKKESLSEALTGVAVAVTKALTSQPAVGNNTDHSSIANVRMKNLEQLKILQHLKEDSILSEDEFAEQKTIILEALRKLN